MNSISRISLTAWIALLTAGILLFVGCGTKRNTWATRGYHNMTSRYNGYYYADESVKDGIEKLKNTHKDDYTKIIPVFIYPTPEEVSGISPEMDRAIKKLSIIIHRHTITTKSKKEIPGAVKWIDDSYLLIGKSHFYKRDFFSALETFEYVSKIYTKFPSRFMARMWMIRTYDELGSISQAESLIDLLSEEKGFPKEYVQEYEAIKGYHFILRENYSGAMKHIHKAALMAKKKKDKARLFFILAQLNQRDNNLKDASFYYSQVIRLKPNYELAFNAQINRANCVDVNSPAALGVKKELIKMLKDDKNIEYHDQLYYALAQIAEREKNKPAMIDYLQKSIRASETNINQKAYSYLKLADTYFEDTEYTKAQAYYDSTISLVQKEFPNYELIKNKKESLSKLVANLNVIYYEDSIQRVAAMSEKERDMLIAKVMQREEEEAKRKEEEKQNKQLEKEQAVSDLSKVTSSTSNGQWYFYNPPTVAYGKTDFMKKWGDRKYEDNWRRSNKEQVMDVNTGGVNVSGGDTSTTKQLGAESASNKKDKNYYLKNLPLTGEAIKKSNDKIIDAYYNCGSIYKEQLSNNARAVEAFEELLKRFSDNKYTLTVYYQLYRLFLAMDNKPKAEYYKNIFVTKYPDSQYTKIILNPGYAQEKEGNLREAEIFYQETYKTYVDGNYKLTIERCHQAATTLGKNPFLAKFDLLQALAIGRVKGVDEFEDALTRIIIKYPKDEIKDKAQEYLDMIKSQKQGPDATKNFINDSLAIADVNYVFDKDAIYYWVVVNNGSADLNKTKIALSDINSKFYSLDNLSTESVLLDIERPMVLVKNFTGKEKAMMYYKLVNDTPEALDMLSKDKIQTFVISEENYPLFYKSKDINKYLNFFKEKLLK